MTIQALFKYVLLLFSFSVSSLVVSIHHPASPRVTVTFVLVPSSVLFLLQSKLLFDFLDSRNPLETVFSLPSFLAVKTRQIYQQSLAFSPFVFSFHSSLELACCQIPLVSNWRPFSNLLSPNKPDSLFSTSPQKRRKHSQKQQTHLQTKPLSRTPKIPTTAKKVKKSLVVGIQSSNGSHWCSEPC